MNQPATTKLRSPQELRQLSKKLADERSAVKRQVVVTTHATCCMLQGSESVAGALKAALEGTGVPLKTVSCIGFCQVEPIVIIEPDGIFYQKVGPEDAKNIVRETILGNNIVDSLLHKDSTGKRVQKERDVPFFKRQLRVVSGHNRCIDPHCIDDYIGMGGYTALAKALFDMKPEQIIDEIKRSGLRGRGGAGFPTGRKWESCRHAPSSDGIRYVICNADEGDPGAYANRGLLEGNPHSVIEGMIIGAFAIGSSDGIVYVRNEYPLAVSNLGIALKQAADYGLLGKNILGSGFDFDIRITKGGGAFVCGESTALMASLEGKVGEPRAKYVHTVEKGLYNRPSNLNNVETWANVPLIINKGVPWFTSIGTGDVTKDPWGGSKGTKIFSLVGKINNTGLIEVPMGMTLREIMFDIGGGIRDGKRFKAVQTGGPSGGCIPATLLDLPVDFDRLSESGSMMGSGGMIVMDEDTCMVDIARYFLDFTTKESCGKCVPCREGTSQMLAILSRITEGKGRKGDVELLRKLSEVVAEASLCALGSTAPNPVLTTIKYFRDEYDAHILEQRCPAMVCKALIKYSVDPQKCKGCQACVAVCPVGAIAGEKKQPHRIAPSKCVTCGACVDTCKFDAVVVQKK